MSVAWKIPLLGLALALTGCQEGVLTLDPPSEPFQTEARESPMLTEKVKTGLLPPLAERLPENPMVVPTYGPHASYGGELRIIVGNFWDFGALDIVNSSRLVRHVAKADADGNILLDAEGRPEMELVGNLVEWWEYSEDGKVISMRLRKGLRYSDGMPFTTEDIEYRWGIWNDTERYSEVIVFPSINISGEAVKLEVLDEWNFRIILPEPNFQWLSQQANYLQFWETPKHWLGAFDPTVNPELTSWDDFKRRLGSASDPTRPTIGAWQLTRWEEAGVMVAERNPYFYMVDREGRQLPYIDSIRGSMIRTPDVALMRAMNGQVDIFDGADLLNLPLLKAGEERGGYTIGLHGEGPGTFPGLFMNFFTERPGLAELMQNVEFRRALSMSIDRDEINDLVFSGFGTPTNVSIEDWHREKFSNLNRKEAARIFENLGLRDLSGDGILQYPDGRNVTIVITTLQGVYSSVAELAASHLRAVGIDAIVQNVHPNQFAVQRRNRQFDLLTAHNGGFDFAAMNRTGWSPITDKVDFTRPEGKGLFDPFSRYYASGGKEGISAPQEMQAAMELLHKLNRQMAREKDPDKAREIAKQISAIWADQVFMIGIVGRAPVPLMISRRVLNVPSVVLNPPEGIWVRSGLYPYQLVLDPRLSSSVANTSP